MLYNIPLFQCFVSPCNVYPVLFIVVDFIIHRQIRGGDRDALSPRPISFILTVRKRSLGQGDVLTPVCHSVHGGLHPGGVGQTPPCPPSNSTGYGQRASGMHPFGMHSCHAVLAKTNNRLVYRLLGLTLPPLENTGSATEMLF